MDAEMNFFAKPMIQVLPYKDPLYYALSLCNYNNIVFLDSAMMHPQLGRYSYLAIDPFKILTFQNNNAIIDGTVFSNINIFNLLADNLARLSIAPNSELPPFQ